MALSNAEIVALKQQVRALYPLTQARRQNLNTNVTGVTTNQPTNVDTGADGGGIPYDVWRVADAVIDALAAEDETNTDVNVSAGNFATRFAAQITAASNSNLTITQSGNNFSIAGLNDEGIQDVVGDMLNVTLGSSGITFSYNDTTGKLDIDFSGITSGGGGTLNAQGLVDLINNSEGNVDAALDTAGNKVALTGPTGGGGTTYDDGSIPLTFGTVTSQPHLKLRTVSETGGNAIDIPSGVEHGAAEGGLLIRSGDFYAEIPFSDLLDIPVDATNDTTVDTSGNTQNAILYRSASTGNGYESIYAGATSTDKLLVLASSNDGSNTTDVTDDIRIWVLDHAHRGTFHRNDATETTIADSDTIGFFDVSESFSPPKLITFANLKTAIGGTTPVNPPAAHEQAYFGAQSSVTDNAITNYVLANMHSADVQTLGTQFTMWDENGNNADGNDNRSGIYLEPNEYLVLLIPANRDGDTLEIHDVATNVSTKNDYTRLTDKRDIGSQEYNVYHWRNTLSLAVYRLDNVRVATS